MDDIERAILFDAYKSAHAHLKELESAIEAEVLALAATQKLSGVTATYYQPSIEFDYEAAAKHCAASDSLIAEHTTMKPVTRWKEIAEIVTVGTDVLRFAKEKPARVVVKV